MEKPESSFEKLTGRNRAILIVVTVSLVAAVLFIGLRFFLLHDPGCYKGLVQEDRRECHEVGVWVPTLKQQEMDYWSDRYSDEDCDQKLRECILRISVTARQTDQECDLALEPDVPAKWVTYESKVYCWRRDN